MIFLIKLRGLPSFYDQRLTRYRFWALLTPFGHIWPCLVILRHFRSSERYELYETLIGIWCFWSKWGVYQVSKINGSWYIDFCPLLTLFGHFWPLLTLFGQFWALPVPWGVYIIWKANRNMGFLSKMRGQTTSEDHLFLRYCIFVVFWGLNSRSDRKSGCPSSIFAKLPQFWLFYAQNTCRQRKNGRPPWSEKKVHLVPTLFLRIR